MIEKITIVLLMASLLLLFIKNNKMSAQIADMKLALIEKTYGIKDNDPVKEDFLKFVSESREWAFEYIEEVQQGLQKFVDGVDKHISYFDEYGDSMAFKPNYESLAKISKEYKELKKLLPTEENK